MASKFPMNSASYMELAAPCCWFSLACSQKASGRAPLKLCWSAKEEDPEDPEEERRPKQLLLLLAAKIKAPSPDSM